MILITYDDDITCAHYTVGVQSLLPVVERDQTLGNTDRDSTPLQSIPIIKHFLPLTPDQSDIRCIDQSEISIIHQSDIRDIIQSEISIQYLTLAGTGLYHPLH